MKSKSTSLGLLLLILFIVSILPLFSITTEIVSIRDQGETEDNGTVEQANDYTLNSTINGSIGFYDQDDQIDGFDFFKITTLLDGELYFRLSPSAELNTGISLIDVDGINLVQGVTSSGLIGEDDLLVCSFLEAGTYYVRVTKEGTKGTYSLTNIFTPAEFESDPESNDVYEDAIAVEANSTSYGHLGFYSNSEYDAYDWYQLTTPVDGALTIEVSQSAFLDHRLTLIESDGGAILQTCLECGSLGANTKLVMENLRAGTYYVRIWLYQGYGSYTLSNQFIPATFENDKEFNDSVESAISLSKNDSVTGHIGFYSNSYTDLYDWYTIDWQQEAPFTVIGEPVGDLDITMDLYTKSDMSYVWGYDKWTYNGVNENDTIAYQNLAVGVYVLRIMATNAGKYGSYSLRLVTPENALEPDNNDTLESAELIENNEELTGALDEIYDTDDYYKMVHHSDGLLSITCEPDQSLEVTVSLINASGYEIAIHDETVNSKGEVVANAYGMKKGTYYIHLANPQGSGEYNLHVDFKEEDSQNDIEENNEHTDATVLLINEHQAGHIGYWNLEETDHVDWYYFNVEEKGAFSVEVMPSSNIDIDLQYRYGENVNSVLHCNECGGQGEMDGIVLSDLEAGTHYIKLECLNGFGAYDVFLEAIEEVGNHQMTEPEIYIYPNPASDVLILDLSTDVFQMNSICIYAVSGQLVRSFLADEEMVEIDISKLEAGVYFIHLQGMHATVIRKVLVY